MIYNALGLIGRILLLPLSFMAYGWLLLYAAPIIALVVVMFRSMF